MRAFTLIEILIVISVIGILATITVVSYRGITGNAAAAVLKSDIKEAAGQLNLAKASNGVYPVNANNLSKSEGTTYQYTVTGSDYCLSATSLKAGINAYYLSSTSVGGVIEEGVCIGHVLPTDDQPDVSIAGWWKFNGDANDSSGRGNDGTVIGATLTTGQNGQVNGAYSFDGGSKYIDLSSSFWSGKFQDLTGNLNDFTVSAWVKLNSYPSERSTIIGQRYQDAMNFGVKPDGKIYLRMDDTTLGGANSVVGLGSWHFVSVVFLSTGSSASNGTYYLDGNPDGSEYLWDGNGIDTESNMYIGWQNRSGVGTSSYFPGSIDDVRVYGRALNSSEIQALYAAGAQ